DTTVAGIKVARKVAACAPVAGKITEEFRPGDGAESDADLLQWARDTATTIYHPTSTCRMGADDNAVVDPRLRVNGIEGLRIADASIMPEIVSGNTNAPAIMIGEKAADMILQDCG
ncbi:MAG: choline dehydrogenase, partial [Rhizobiales bacterium]|nr:choline dehydrogenase [Hyphomicrobiales bacterium]